MLDIEYLNKLGYTRRGMNEDPLISVLECLLELYERKEYLHPETVTYIEFELEIAEAYFKDNFTIHNASETHTINYTILLPKEE